MTGDAEEPAQLRRSTREPELGEVFVDVNGGDVTNVILNLQRAWHLRGRLLFEDGGTVEMNRLQLQAGLIPTPVAWDTAVEPPARVNADLTFELKGLSRRPMVAFISGIPDGWAVRSIRCDGRDVRGLPLDVANITPESRLEVTLTNRVARPSIRVIDDQNQPVTSYLPILMPADLRRAGVEGQPSRPSGDGVMALGWILPGEYLLAALSFDDYRTLQQQPDWLKNLAPLAQRVTFVEGLEQMIELKLLSIPPQR
jgi:hypothetical protein